LLGIGGEKRKFAIAGSLIQTGLVTKSHGSPRQSRVVLDTDLKLHSDSNKPEGCFKFKDNSGNIPSQDIAQAGITVLSEYSDLSKKFKLSENFAITIIA
jgi:hypothetical protein